MKKPWQSQRSGRSAWDPFHGPLAAGKILLAALVGMPLIPVHWAQTDPQVQPKSRILVRITDENGLALVSAHVLAQQAEAGESFRCETDDSGHCELKEIPPGTYVVRVQKEGFYAVDLAEVRAVGTVNLEVILNHFQEYQEVVRVVDSPQDIDLARTASSRKLVHQDILNLPYKTTRDFRNVLPLMPGVLQDIQGQIHPGGAASHQVAAQMDGFRINHPATGLLETRISVDALRSLQLETSRYSVEHGKGSGGVLSVETGMGDDRLRFSATNFLPAVQLEGGFLFDKWTPRFTFSGPLHKGKAWFFEGISADYSQDIFPELPSEANRSTSWRANSLTKTQLNWNAANILTAGFLVNYYHVDHSGLSRLNPVETTRELQQNVYLFTLKNQTLLAKELLLEVGLGVGLSQDTQKPLGQIPYVLYPGGTSGSYFETSESSTQRTQGLASLYLPPVEWKGRHRFKVGADISGIRYRQYYARQSVSMLRQDGTLTREATFPEIPEYLNTNVEYSSYVQDRWSLSDRLIVELGLRFDRDRVIRRNAVAPRFAASYLVNPEGSTKISAGAGLFYDSTRLELVTRPLAGRRLDRFFAADGRTPIGPPVETSFQVNRTVLRVPRVFNWSVGLEQKLPMSFFLRSEFLQKHGRKGLTFVNPGNPQRVNSQVTYLLQSQAQDRYDAVEITIRRTFKSSYMFLISYLRSSARTNKVLDFSVSELVIGRQAEGPLSWDTPDRFLTWGWIPLWKKFDLAYSLDWRDGFPFSLVNEEQWMVEPPNTRRFPAYFTLNVHVERRFHWWRYQWALRAGFNNLTNRQNPTVVDNNIDSPDFLSYAGLEHRTFTARIRFIGRR